MGFWSRNIETINESLGICNHYKKQYENYYLNYNSQNNFSLWADKMEFFSNKINNLISTTKTMKQFTILIPDNNFFATTVHYFWNIANKSMGIDGKSNFSKIWKKSMEYNSGLLLINIFSKPTNFDSFTSTRGSNSSRTRKILIFWLKKSFFRLSKIVQISNKPFPFGKFLQKKKLCQHPGTKSLILVWHDFSQFQNCYGILRFSF